MAIAVSIKYVYKQSRDEIFEPRVHVVQVIWHLVSQ